MVRKNRLLHEKTSLQEQLGKVSNGASFWLELDSSGQKAARHLGKTVVTGSNSQPQSKLADPLARFPN